MFRRALKYRDYSDFKVIRAIRMTRGRGFGTGEVEFVWRWRRIPAAGRI